MAADDSYKVKFYTPVISEIQVTINAVVAPSYRASDVKQQIIDVILRELGKGSPASRRGYSRPSYQRLYALLKAGVPALSAGESDVRLQIADDSMLTNKPEMWRYATTNSLSVTVDAESMATSVWGV